MAITKAQKYQIFEKAVNIANEAAKGGGLSTSGAIVHTLEQAYEAMVKIVEEIEK